MNRKYIYILFGLLLGTATIITSCQRDEEVIVSTITTNEPSYIHADNAGISVELDYNGTPKQYGICYSTEPSPTIKNQLALCADSVGQLCELVGLEAATMYYARAFVQNRSDVLYGNEITFTTTERLTEAGYEYVDMGLSVKWATMNVGATAPEEGGKYYAWGEVEEKETYMWDNYHYGNSRTTLTKYCDSEAYGTVDNKAVLDLLDDAAYMSWGGKWRMPTYNEWDELLRNSTWTWVEQNGVKGVRVRSTKNGNCIFLPTTGYKVGADLNYKDVNIGFWSGSLSKNGSYMSYGVSIENPNNTASFYGFNRYNGYPIRAVMDNAITPPAVDIPTVVTSAASEVTKNSAVVGGNVLSDGGLEVTERGVYYSMNANPIETGTKVECGSGLGEFTHNLTDLQTGAIYYVRAYAKNKFGVAYGEEISFVCEALPTVTTTQPTNVSYTSATIGGNVTDDGGLEVTERGVVYGTNQKPTTADSKVANGSGLGQFTCNLTDLQDGMTYYARAYAVNAKGTAYGEEVSFTTKQQFVPTIVTTQPTNVAYNSATVGGNVTNDGGAEVTERGMVYGTSQNPTTEDGKVASGSGLGEFTCDLTALQDGVTYYARAYAINAKGMVYGEEVSFTTKQQFSPTIATVEPINVTATSATVGGNVTSDGGAEVTERGIAYATTQNPTTADSKVTSGSGLGQFTCNLTDLQDGTTYYARAYAINAKGTAYGEVVSLTTLSLNGHEYVDLGLSVKWATMNVGANSPEDYGDYFAWGETSIKNTYNWSTYKWCNGSSSTLTKYNTSSTYGTVDNKTQLELSDDAAHVNWGGSWRMPTDAELTELRNNCTWTWTSQNGVRGYKITSKSNDNSIFLPLAGYSYDSSLSGTSYGYYRSSSLLTYSPLNTYGLYFGFNTVLIINDYRTSRYFGHSVRPVCP